jgi:hypothetical protein
MITFLPHEASRKAKLEERRTDFHSEADARFAKILQTGKTIPWSEMRRYIKARAAGQSASRPVAKRQRS